ncbi:acyl-CoA dehydrogenase family protein [Staphylococcus canis]|uniref:Acyl-CoA/acyl-ACP dehydrogenase n=1 Tax=Staphylococcus canis TaxID=2724942 RepID=A0ABS0TAD9_9STAP|nr:acyl-CoA dehydrogenase family protein [Staphylococcus canis]MBI5975720.1 acyl-CoA/acyl-ACP dehydrogenase [Staphylococcus canis]
MTLDERIKNELDPYVVDIDNGDYYAKPFIQHIFEDGNFSSKDLLKNAQTVEAVSQSCLTTGFCLWCQLAFSTYLSRATQPELHDTLQQQLMRGEVFGATGLSNPMKSFNDLEQFNLSHHYDGERLVVNGRLPAVSNIGEDHYFGAISKHQDSDELVMFIVRGNTPGITLNAPKQFLGVNGSATYGITFEDVVVPDEWIISKDAKAFASEIRPQFVTLQIPIALGSIRSSLDLIHQFSNAQNGINQYLEYDIKGYEARYNALRSEYYQLIETNPEALQDHFADIIRLKKELGYLLLDVNQASMVNGGSRAYTPTSPQTRKLKEGFFFAALTPTLRHLGKLEAELQHS